MPNIGPPELIILAIILALFGLPLIVVLVLFRRRHEHWEPPPHDEATPPKDQWHRPR